MSVRTALLGPLPEALAESLRGALADAGSEVVAAGSAPARLDLVVAGRVGSRQGPLADDQFAPGDGVVAAELVPLLTLAQDVAPALRAGRGVLVLVASPLALRAAAARAADSVVDAAIAMLGALLAVELADGGARCVVAAPAAADRAAAEAILALAAAPVSGAVVPLGDVSTAVLFADVPGS